MVIVLAQGIAYRSDGATAAVRRSGSASDRRDPRDRRQLG
jgi:hypothetical protein